jgi:hypothetical protein
LNLDFETTIPCEYQTIEEKYNRYSHFAYSSRENLFLVCKDGKCGMLNFNGTVRIPLHYKSIEPIWFDRYCRTSKIQYKVTNENDLCGYLESNGDTIVPLKYKQGNLLRLTTDTCNEQSLTIALMTLDNRMTAYNIGAKTVSKTYSRLWFHEGLLVYQDNWNNGVLDENFNTLINFDSGRLSTNKGEQMNRCFTANGQVFPKNKRTSDFIRKDSLIFRIDPTIERMRFGRVKMLKKGERALVNYYTGKSTPLDYEYLYAKYLGEDTLYWAIDYNGSKHSNYVQNKKKIPILLHVYNDQLELINSISYLRDELGKVRSDDAMQVPENDLVFLENTDHKLGAINSKGEIKIEFEYDSHSLFTQYGEEYIIADSENNFRGSRTTEIVHIYGKDNKFGLINSDAEIVLPFVYDKIGGGGFFLNAIKGDTTFRYAMNNFRFPKDTLVKLPKVEGETPKIEVARGIAHSDSRKEYREEIPYVDRFTIKKGFLYYKYPDSMAIVDSNLFKMNWPLRSIAAHYLVDGSGKVMFNKPHVYYSDTNCNVLFVKGSVRILDNKGKCLEKKKRARTIQKKGNYLILHSKKYKSRGVFNARTNEWMKSFSNYDYIDGVWNSSLSEVQFWVASEKYKLNTPFYNLVDTTNSLVFPFQLNETVRLDAKDLDVKTIMSGSKTGIISKDFKIIVPPEYNYVQQLDTTYFLYNDKKWGIQCGAINANDQFDCISNEHFKNGFVVFRNDNIAVLNHRLEFILPFTSKEDLIANHNLGALLGLNNFEVGAKSGVQISKEPSKNEIALVNKNIWSYCRIESTDGLFARRFEFSEEQKRKAHGMYHGFEHDQSDIHSYTSYFDGIYASEYIRLKTWSKSPYNDMFKLLSTDYYCTYKIEDGKITRLGLIDLLINGGEEKLDSLIIKELNKHQVFGVNCVDLPEKIERIKDNFQLSRLGLKFNKVSANHSTITIPYEDLDGILKMD